MSRPADRAYRVIRQDILDGSVAPGSRLKEEDLAIRTGVSRTPVREALRRLLAEGLAERLDGATAIRVPDLSARDIDDAFRLRALLESHAAAEAARRIVPATVAHLQSLVDSMEDLVAGGGKPDHYLVLNGEFHRTILEAAGSRRLLTLMPHVIDLPIVIRTFHAFDQAALARSNVHHRALVTALTHRDADWSAAVMRAHIGNAWTSLQRLLPPPITVDGAGVDDSAVGPRRTRSPRGGNEPVVR